MSDRLYNHGDVHKSLIELDNDDLSLAGYADVASADFLGMELRFSPSPIDVVHEPHRGMRQLSQEQQQMQQQGDGYYVTKPYNVVLNWKKLLTNIPENALIVGGALSASWMMIMAALVLTKKLLDLQSIKLTGDQATVMLVLGAKFGMGRAAEEDQLYLEVEKHLAGCGMSPMSAVVFHRAIDDLIQLRSIDVKDGKVHLVEEIPLELMEMTYVEKD